MMTTTAAIQAPVVVDEQKPQHAILFDLDSCQVHGVASDIVTIGTSERCNIKVADQQLSAQHCMIVRNVDGYSLYDLNSNTGCSVNGMKVQENCPIFDGDEVSIGDKSFVFNLVDRDRKPQFAGKPATRFSWVKAFSNYLKAMGKH